VNTKPMAPPVHLLPLRKRAEVLILNG